MVLSRIEFCHACTSKGLQKLIFNIHIIEVRGRDSAKCKFGFPSQKSLDPTYDGEDITKSSTLLYLTITLGGVTHNNEARLSTESRTDVFHCQIKLNNSLKKLSHLQLVKKVVKRRPLKVMPLDECFECHRFYDYNDYVKKYRGFAKKIKREKNNIRKLAVGFYWVNVLAGHWYIV